MLSRQVTKARPLFSSCQRLNTQKSRLEQIRHASVTGTDVAEETDPGMNGGYVNPPPRKRALRDPHADWWDKQERRNFGEPVHEDNDVLGVFTTEPYTHSTPGRAAPWVLGVFVGGILALSAATSQLYPDRPSAPRTYPNGLEPS